VDSNMEGSNITFIINIFLFKIEFFMEFDMKNGAWFWRHPITLIF